MSAKLISIAELNSCGSIDSFMSVVSCLFEAAPCLAHKIYAKRPYASYTELIDEAESVVNSKDLSQKELLEVINAHPRLGAARNTLSAHSLKEQGYNTTQTATEDEEVNEMLTKLNDQYETKFGFKFVIFVNGRKRKDILPIIEEKINGENTKEQELQRGLKDMILIARDRLRKMGQN
ncbi:hypothetical protein MP638_004869 [Amoeboaphelidium occidentale]|nr:hypothetical protein MP638_004869 [Amoeboaphelidium occidentale]